MIADLNPAFESLIKEQTKEPLPTKALKFKISKVPLKQAKPQQTYSILGIQNLSPPSFEKVQSMINSFF